MNLRELRKGLRARFASDPEDLKQRTAEYNNERNTKIRELEAETKLQRKLARREAIRRSNAEAALERAQRARHAEFSSRSSNAASRTIPEPEEEPEEVDARNAHLSQSNGDDDGHDGIPTEIPTLTLQMGPESKQYAAFWYL